MDGTQRGFLGYNPRPAWLSFPQKPLGLRIFQGTVEDWQGEIRGCGFPARMSYSFDLSVLWQSKSLLCVIPK